MEQALRAHSLSSASARRKRIQQRQEEQQRLRLDARKRALALQELDNDDDDESESASASDDNMPPSNDSRDDSVDTLSEYSPMTPEPLYERRVSITDSAKPGLQIVVPGRNPVATLQKPKREPSPGPKLQASLTNFSDFHYDRFSMIVDTPIDIVQSPVSESEELETPCEVATPISYTLPQTRPAVISITSNKKRRTSSASSSLLQHAARRSSIIPPDIPAKSSRRLSQMSTRSGFLASEAAPLSVPELPRNAMYMIANASRDSLAISTQDPTVKEPFQRPLQTRKNSMPLLSAAFKSGHARLNSIKGLVSPTFPSPPSSVTPHHRPDSLLRHHTQPSISLSRPRTAVAASTPAEDLSFETVPADLNDPLPAARSKPSTHRPSTSHASTRASMYSMTALPTPPASIDMAPDAIEQSHGYTSYESHSQSREAVTPSPELSMRRKKSFSALRKRGESISNAIKFVKKGGSSASPRDSQTAPPPLPTINRTSTTNTLLDVSRPTTARSSSTGGFMGNSTPNTTGSSHTSYHSARKSIDLFRSFASGNSSSHSRGDAVAAGPSTATSSATTATMPRSSMRADVAPRSPVVRLQQQQPQPQPQQSIRRIPSSYSVFPTSRGEHGRSMIGLGIRT